MLTVQSLIGASVLALIHFFAGKLRFLDVLPRSRWLSIAGGVAVAYALVHLLPELQAYHQPLAETAVGEWMVAERLIWGVTLIGLVIFYGLEKAVLGARQTAAGSTDAVFWLHISSYAIYNALIGYLLVREDRDWTSLVLFVVGIGLHFVVNDHGLRQHHKQQYHRYGRWMLSAAVLVGWVIGVATEIHEAITGVIVALLAGGILLNTFKEELPEERESRFWAFSLGAFGYAAMMLFA